MIPMSRYGAFTRWSLMTALISLTGCNPPQPLNFSVQDLRASSNAVDADLKNVTVTPAAPNERSGDLPPAVGDITDKWKEATLEALGRTALFNDDSHHHVNLEIKVFKVDLPSLLNSSTQTDAQYTLIDRSSGAIVFRRFISSRGDASIDFVLRGRESANRSVQSNIGEFIDALEHSPVASARVGHPTS